MQKTTGIEPKPDVTVAEVNAVRACIIGSANGDQQKLAMDWIMREAARVPDLSYRPTGKRRVQDFNEGRRYVGILIRYMLLAETLADAKIQDEKREAKR